MVQALNRFDFKKIFFIVSVFLLTANAVIASKHEDFEFLNQIVIFKKNIELGKCTEKIAYPKLLLKDNQRLADKMNIEINKIISNHKMCNSKSENYQFDTTYEIIKASDNVMSIKWTTTNNNKMVHIDAISFFIENGKVVSVEQILNPLAKNFMPQMIKYSRGILTKNADWSQFLQKVADKSIQYYMEKDEWRLLFNHPFDSGQHPLPLKSIPRSFLKQESNS